MTVRRERRPPTASDRKAKRTVALPFALGDKLDTTKAKDLAAALVARRGAPVSLDASKVQHLGAQCAQILLSARLSWAKDGHDFQIKAVSDGFNESLRLLGLANDFGVFSA